MFSSVDKQHSSLLARHRYGKVAAWVLMFLLVLQLVSSTQHRHDLASHASDCASCFVANHLPSDLPVADLPAVLPGSAKLAYLILGSRYYLYFAPVSFLIPRGQAPPAPFFAA